MAFVDEQYKRSYSPVDGDRRNFYFGDNFPTPAIDGFHSEFFKWSFVGDCKIDCVKGQSPEGPLHGSFDLYA